MHKKKERFFALKLWTFPNNFSGIGQNGDEFIQTLEGIFARYIDRLDDE